MLQVVKEDLTSDSVVNQAEDPPQNEELSSVTCDGD